MLLVVYDIKTDEVIGQLRSKALEYGEINQILPNAFLLDAVDTDGKIGKDMSDIVSKHGRFFIGRVRRREVNGWLANETVDWINNKNFD